MTQTHVNQALYRVSDTGFFLDRVFLVKFFISLPLFL